MIETMWTNCSSKAARLLDAGVDVVPVLPRRVGDRVRYTYPTWVGALCAGLLAAGAPEHTVYAAVRRAVAEPAVRGDMLAALRAGQGRRARALSAAVQLPG